MKLPNYTQVMNEFIDTMHKYNGAEVKIFIAISRKTIGWHKTSDRIPHSQLKKITGITSANTLRAGITTLVNDGWITQEKLKNGYSYDLCLDNELCQKLTPPVSKTDTDRVSKTDTSKETVKDTTQKLPATQASLHTQLRNTFERFYLEKKGVLYYWQAKDARNLKLIINAISYGYKQKYDREPEDVKITYAFDFLLHRITDNWILNNLSVSIIYSKFNEIVARAKEPRTLEQANDEALRDFISSL